MAVTPQVWRPSSARRLVLDGFAPVARGATVAAPLPLSFPAKDPADVLDYEFDVTAALLGNEGDHVADVAVTVDPSGLVVGDVKADGAMVVLWLSGGAAGTTYTLELAITTAAGRAVSRAVLLPVLSLSTVSPPVSVLTTQSGAVISDQNGNPILLGG